MQDLARKRVLVTGGAAFLGAWVVRRLRELGCQELVIPRRRDWDLTQDSAVQRLFETNPSRAEREFGFRARTPFPEGLERTVRWYLAERQASR